VIPSVSKNNQQQHLNFQDNIISNIKISNNSTPSKPSKHQKKVNRIAIWAIVVTMLVGLIPLLIHFLPDPNPQPPKHTTLEPGSPHSATLAANSTSMTTSPSDFVTIAPSTPNNGTQNSINIGTNNGVIIQDGSIDGNVSVYNNVYGN
jgi:hypothetical protein